MKSFKSVRNFITENVGTGRELTFVVENDIDRNNLPADERWADLMSEPVNIDGRVFMLSKIQGHDAFRYDITSFDKGSLIGLTILKEIKQ